MKNIYILKNNYVLRKVLHKTQKDQREAISYKPKHRTEQIHSAQNNSFLHIRQTNATVCF